MQWFECMDEIKKYFISLEDVPESERIIFKMICSVSVRTKGRSIHYLLSTDESEGNADIVIRNTLSGQTDRYKSGEVYRIEPVNQDSCVNKKITGILTRPLIATRVLTGLDEFVDSYFKQDDACIEQDVYSDFEFKGDDKIRDSVNEDTVNLELSEEEACELAIVHDESLTNPANRENEYLEEIQPAEVTPIALARNDVSEQLKGAPEKKSGIDSIEQESSKEQPSRVLVVDDSPSVRKQLEIELDLFNADVDYAATAKEAMDYLETDVYDVAFLDVVLPDKVGFTICRYIKEMIKDTSVIMLTGKAKQADKVKGALAGCDAYMVKPVGRMTFQATARKFLSLIESPSAVEA